PCSIRLPWLVGVVPKSGFRVLLTLHSSFDQEASGIFFVVGIDPRCPAVVRDKVYPVVIGAFCHFNRRRAGERVAAAFGMRRETFPLAVRHPYRSPARIAGRIRPRRRARTE